MQESVEPKYKYRKKNTLSSYTSTTWLISSYTENELNLVWFLVVVFVFGLFGYFLEERDVWALVLEKSWFITSKK